MTGKTDMYGHATRAGSPFKYEETAEGYYRLFRQQESGVWIAYQGTRDPKEIAAWKKDYEELEK